MSQQQQQQQHHHQYTTASFHISSHCTRWLFPNLPLLSSTQIQKIKLSSSSVAPHEDSKGANSIESSLLQNYSILERNVDAFHQPRAASEFLSLFAKFSISHKLTVASFLTFQQEMALINDCTNKMWKIMEGYDKKHASHQSYVPKFLERVKATAILYFRRFFHKRSVMEWNTTHILVACMFLATKSEEMHLDVANFETTLQQLTGSKQLTRAVFLPAELVLLDGLDFDLQVMHPYRSMVAFIYGVWGTASNDNNASTLNTINEKAHALVEQMLINTNVALIFTPGVIALGVISAALEQLGLSSDQLTLEQQTLNTYIQQQFQKADERHYDKLLLQIQRVKECALDIPSVDTSEIKEISKKLKRIHKVVTAYKEKEQEQIKEQLRKEDKLKEERRQQAIRQDEEQMETFLRGSDSGERKTGGLFG